MRHTAFAGAALLLFVGLSALPTPADAQILNRVRDAAARAAEREVVRAVDREVTEAVSCVLDDQACIDNARREGQEVQLVDANGNPVSAPTSAAAPAASGAPAATAFVNFDFIPGERILYADDFARDEVGNFPRSLEFARGNMELAEWQGGRWLRGTSWPSSFAVVRPEVLPERFTVEMEVVPGQNNQPLRIRFSEDPQQFIEARYFQRRLSGGLVTAGSAVAVGNTTEEVAVGTPFLLRVMADGSYVKVYIDGTRVANVPNAQIGRSNRIEIDLAGSDQEAGFVRGVRIAAGGKKLYDALAESGRVATQGIYFDTGSDVIRPESGPTLKEIGEMLQERGDLRIAIEGHTDNVGDAGANQQLSERRAAAVKAYLEREFGVTGTRLEARGMGASQPAADNGTPEGRQQNRRVELVQL